MFHQVCRAVEPATSLISILARWSGVARDLAESNRRRKLQSFDLND
jgi:hypothetical protein